MTEQRRVRFDTLDMLDHEDLPLVCEIWMDELVHAPWAPREAMKLGTYLVRYIHEPDATQMTLSALESVVQLTREDVRRSLAILQSFSFITSFTMERDGIHVAMRLSQLQQIRVLETRSRRDRAIAERCTARSVGATNQSWIAPAAIPQPEAANEQAPKAA